MLQDCELSGSHTMRMRSLSSFGWPCVSFAPTTDSKQSMQSRLLEFAIVPRVRACLLPSTGFRVGQPSVAESVGDSRLQASSGGNDRRMTCGNIPCRERIGGVPQSVKRQRHRMMNSMRRCMEQRVDCIVNVVGGTATFPKDHGSANGSGDSSDCMTITCCTTEV